MRYMPPVWVQCAQRRWLSFMDSPVGRGRRCPRDVELARRSAVLGRGDFTLELVRTEVGGLKTALVAVLLMGLSQYMCVASAAGLIGWVGGR